MAHSFCTDNFQVRPFEFLGVQYWSCEQAYQALRHPPGKDYDVVCAVKPFAGETDKSHGMRAYSKGHQGTDRADWNEVKLSLMLELNRAKYDQHADLREDLLATVSARIIGPPLYPVGSS